MDLNTLSKDELIDLKKRIAAAIERQDAARLAAARAEVERIAREAGVNLSDLVSRDTSKTAGKSKLPAKYRHPSRPELTWAGRGKQPQWYKEAIADGLRKEDLLVEAPETVS